MLRRLHQIDADLFTVSDVFSREECTALIARAESIGFEAASVRTSHGPQMMTNVRNNDRVVVHDVALADQMWQRIEPFLPIIDDCVPCGVDSQLRLYRYVPGQQFKRHKDGAVTNDSGHTSRLSYLIYLNDDCDGGSTNFRDYHEANGMREKVEIVVKPVMGSALLFRHERWHEGTPVTAGSKYVLRTDVFYGAI
jgi:predicted 2-oxoglutarate/Fe(II)-dependent dioxygenase YbiX